MSARIIHVIFTYDATHEEVQTALRLADHLSPRPAVRVYNSGPVCVHNDTDSDLDALRDAPDQKAEAS